MLRKDLIKLKNLTLENLRVIMILLITTLLLANIAYLLPSKFSATGYFYVTRTATDTNPSVFAQGVTDRYFSYDGYYAQQTAINYTDTVVSILTSPEIAAKVLESTNKPVNDPNLKYLVKNRSVRKFSPQVVALTIKSYSKDEAYENWKTFDSVLLTTSQNMNNYADPELKIIPLSNDPVITQPVKSFVIYTLTGLTCGLALSVFWLIIKKEMEK